MESVGTVGGAQLGETLGKSTDSVKAEHAVTSQQSHSEPQ